MVKRSRLRRGAGSARKQRLKQADFQYDIITEVTERDIGLIKSRLNSGKYEVHLIDSNIGDGWKITLEQTQKGLAFLMKQWKGKSGVPSKNSPFGTREEHVLENFKEFKLTGFYDTATSVAQDMGIHYFQPMYLVIAKDGSAFEYVMDYRKAPKTGVYIIG